MRDVIDCGPILHACNRAFGETPPVSFLLREAIPERWLRIHSLPESKRYPESPAEHREILRRHNRVAVDLLGPGSDCAVLALSACSSPLAKELSDWANHFIDCGQLSESLWDEEDGLFAGPMCLNAARLTWFVGVADDLIRAAALDRIHMLVLNLGSGRAYAPYDGGADLFFSDGSERNAARETYTDWLPAHPSGL